MTRSKASKGKDAIRPVLQLPERPAQRAPVVLPAFDSLPVSADQLSKACTALHAHASSLVAKRAESDLLAGSTDEALELVVTLKRAPSQRRGRVMPVRIDVPHPVIDPRERSVALLVKDPQREYKDLLAAKDVKFISRVVGVTKLKGKVRALRLMLGPSPVTPRALLMLRFSSSRLRRDGSSWPRPTCTSPTTASSPSCPSCSAPSGSTRESACAGP